MHVNLADTLLIKRGNLFLVALRDGRLPADDEHPLGLWYRDCRFLSAHELRLDGAPALLLSASDALGSRAVHELTSPELPLSLRVERVAWDEPAKLREEIVVRSHHHEDLRLDLDLRLAADFEPMLAVRGLVARTRRPPAEIELGAKRLRISARGRDGVVRATTIDLSDEPAEAAATDGAAELRFELELPAGGSRTLVLGFAASESGAEYAVAASRGVPRPAQVHSDDELFDRVLSRSLGDLELLRSELDGHAYFAAGVPWYATLFGRDSLIAAMQVLPFVPELAGQTLRLLGGRLGRELDDARDEEPGKVLHELRVGEPATLGETPFARYYGTADATPLWLCLLCDHADWTGSLDLFRELRPQVEAALGWIERHGDRDGDALVEYRRRARDGLVNQGWKDSWDGVPGADGRPLEPPVALVEVQGYVIRALRGVARLLERDGEHPRADGLRARAGEVEAALERLWLAEPGTYAIGLDAEKRPGSGLTSNAGHLLWAAALPAERARSVRGVLMGDAMFSGWGVRTLADGHPGYNPVGYHTGSVWPHDNAIIAAGLRRHGFDDDFMRLFEALLEAASCFDGYRLPELFGGYARSAGEDPVPYPVACAPQAWAAGAIPYLLMSGLGLSPDGTDRRLRVIRPSLPRWLDRVDIEGLRVIGANVDLRFERGAAGVALTGARVDGDVDVVES
jgi:glycogen debranching enzyme